MGDVSNNETVRKNYGLISVILVYTIWGVQSLYWKAFQGVPLMQLLAHRIIWSIALLTIVILFTGNLKGLIHVFKIRKNFLYIVICAILIGSNWLLNIYASYSNQVIEASLGRYITPIMVIFIGVFRLKENIKFYEILAVITAFVGVSIMTIHLGRIPMIAVLLIVTFAIYTFLKKIIDIDPILGTTAETIILAPFALIYLIYMEIIGEGVVFTSNTQDLFLLISTGVFTAIPLVLFSYGVKHVNLSKIGFIQYYSPTVSLLIGIFILKESFTKIHLISFSFIWAAIAIVLLYSVFEKLNMVLQKKKLTTKEILKNG